MIDAHDAHAGTALFPVATSAALIRPELDPSAYCLVGRLGDLEPSGAPPWAPGRREELADVERRGQGSEDLWCMSEVDIFSDLDDQEMAAIAAAAPMRQFAPGELLYSPPQPMETLFILKQGRVRIFRVSRDGRALTTAIITPGTIFGEMLLLGQQMHDNFAEALDKVTVCVMSRSDVQRSLISDARIAARISGILGNRVAQLERRSPTRSSRACPRGSPPPSSCSPTRSRDDCWRAASRSSSPTSRWRPSPAPRARPPPRSSTSTPSRASCVWAEVSSPSSTCPGCPRKPASRPTRD